MAAMSEMSMTGPRKDVIGRVDEIMYKYAVSFDVQLPKTFLDDFD
jgi:hypothetical protein